MSISLMPGTGVPLATIPGGVSGATADVSADSPVGAFSDLLTLQMLGLGPSIITRPMAAIDPIEAEPPDETLSAQGTPNLLLTAGLPGVVATQSAVSPNAEIPTDISGNTRDVLADFTPQASLTNETALTHTVSSARAPAANASSPDSLIANALPISAPPIPSQDGTSQSVASSATSTELLITSGGRADPQPAANLAATTPSAPTSCDFLSHLNAQINHQAVGTARTATTKPEPVATPMHAANWGQEFGERVLWMARNDQQSAQISINPPQLGPVQISLSLNGDQATASFVSPHAEVRQAIEEALPRLREMLAGAGIDLGQTNVGSQNAQQSQYSQTGDSPRFSDDKAILPGDSGTGPVGAPSPLRSGLGLVDLFA